MTMRPGRDDGRGEADLTLADQDPAAGRDEDEEEGPEQLREQPAPFELRVVPLLARAELELQPVSNPQVVDPRRVGGLRGDIVRLPHFVRPYTRPRVCSFAGSIDLDRAKTADRQGIGGPGQLVATRPAEPKT